jgi:hypothetical protein
MAFSWAAVFGVQETGVSPLALEGRHLLLFLEHIPFWLYMTGRGPFASDRCSAPSGGRTGRGMLQLPNL